MIDNFLGYNMKKYLRRFIKHPHFGNFDCYNLSASLGTRAEK